MFSTIPISKLVLLILMALAVIGGALADHQLSRHYPTPQEKKQAREAIKPMTNWAGAVKNW